MTESHGPAATMAIAMGAGALVVAVCRRLRIPALLPLLGIGLALGSTGLHLVDGNALGSGLRAFVTIAIGLLIFEGALHLNRDELGRAPRAVWGLLTVGAIATWVLGAVSAVLILGFGIPAAILLGAALIVTGPTVVQPLLRVMGVAPRVQTVLAAEAVLVDPIGVLATVTSLEVIRQWLTLGPDGASVQATLWMLARPVMAGCALGAMAGAVGYLVLTIATRRGRADPQFTNLVAVGICLACVGSGEALAAESGLVAVTVCGIVMARARVPGMTELRSVKEYLAVILVGALFILLASRFDAASLRSVGWPEVGFVACLLLIVRPISVALATWRSRLDLRERAFAATFAPRGIVALSVASIIVQELRDALGADSVAVSPTTLGTMALDVGRLETVMFVVIVGTVLSGSLVSPVLARLLGLRSKGSGAVLLVGAHELGRGVALALHAQGIHTRLVDRNADRVRQCRDQGLDAVMGDATDSRWLDDLGAPRHLGAVITWTGNHDVDSVIARWARDRLGPGRCGFWSSRPPIPDADACGLGGGMTIQAAIGALQQEQSILHVVDRPMATDLVVGTCRGPSFAPSPGPNGTDRAQGLWIVLRSVDDSRG